MVPTDRSSLCWNVIFGDIFIDLPLDIIWGACDCCPERFEGSLLSFETSFLCIYAYLLKSSNSNETLALSADLSSSLAYVTMGFIAKISRSSYVYLSRTFSIFPYFVNICWRSSLSFFLPMWMNPPKSPLIIWRAPAWNPLAEFLCLVK